MKAYFVEGTDPDKGCDVVWANNRNEARKKARCCYCCEEDEYINIRATRAYRLDGMEDRVPYGGRAWHSDELRIILVRDYDWSCIDPWNRQECETCPAKQWCHYWDD